MIIQNANIDILGGLFDKWMDNQLPIPKWTPLILPDDILTEELSPASPTPTDDEGNGVRNNNNDNPLEDMTSDDPDDSNKSSTNSTPSTSIVPHLPTHPGCRGGHQMVIDSACQVNISFFLKYTAVFNFADIIAFAGPLLVWWMGWNPRFGRLLGI